jgi:hypothetical protein
MRKIYQTTEVRLIVVAVSVELSCDDASRKAQPQASDSWTNVCRRLLSPPLDFTSSSSSSQPHPDRPLGKMPDEELSNHKRAAKILLVSSFGLKTGSTLMTWPQLALIRGCSSDLEVPTTT